MNKEIWGVHPKYPNYAISSFGRIYSYLKGVFITPQENHNGYLRAKIIPGNGNHRDDAIFVFVHKLVLETFVGKRPNGMVCRHYPDQNKYNNSLENLEWTTPQQNNYDRIENGTYNCAKLETSQILEIKDKILKGYNLIKLSFDYNISLQILSNIKHGNIWKNIGSDISQELSRIKRKKLSPNDAALIKLFLKNNYSQGKLKSIFNVDQSMISKIKTGKHFSDIPIPNLTLKDALNKYNNNEDLI